ncbi:MAG: uridine kinase [Nitrospirae bacterium]|nr:uridine kinase [Nitrospirota bacterium]
MAIVKDKKTGRKEIETEFMGESMSSKTLIASTEGDVIRILPDVNVVKIGGQSVIDRGRPALYPILEELVKNKKKHKLLICVGGGTRARHAYEIALDLELPTGVIAAVGEATPRQNARMVQMLLAKHGGVYILPDDFEKLPLYFGLGCIPIMSGMAPYDYWEKPSETGRIPANRTDSGTFLSAEYLGARSLIYIKDEDGLFTDDPKKNPKAKLIRKISAQELLKNELPDMIVERVVLENMINAHHMRKIQVINGLKKGNITKALNGEHVGTIIYAA